jgi:hypothetical protein
MTWFQRHYERIIVVLLVCGAVPSAMRAFTRRAGTSTTWLDNLEWLMLAWFMLAPVWSIFRSHEQLEKSPLRGLVVSLLVFGYLGISVALSAGR